MKLNTGRRPEDVDELYTYLCEVLDESPAGDQPRILARLCLLLLGEMSDKERAMQLIGQARLDGQATA